MFFMLKSYGWWWVVVVALSNLVSAQGPLGLGLGLKGLGLRVWGQGLTILLRRPEEAALEVLLEVGLSKPFSPLVNANVCSYAQF